ncbi:flagellar export protein FliJ [Sulfurimonas sp. C5]|uniref:flagellar export protein FliJ n=1 Tax=Sulfurimonas sp. C5 TaxID=3036947 RepID=UPI002453E39A|nr:flagellar export protein FliJ [Sulfurimonas sp. C5]MDH4944382.1 flagellar export protein FliJ [Sulfurimonas sp. C5]
MQKSERLLQAKNASLHNAQEALEKSIEEISHIQAPQNGIIADFISNRALLDSQRSLIKHNEEWVAFARGEVELAKEQLKRDMIEYEKYQYLQLQEIEAIKKKEKIKEAKELDEIALLTFGVKERSA